MTQDLNILTAFEATSHEAWMAAVDKQLKGRPFDKVLVKKTYEGIDIQPMYFKKDLDGLDHAATLPGFAPYVRGNRASGNRATPWQVAQETLEPDPSALNRILARDLARGQDTINLRLDNAARQGKDPARTGNQEQGGLSLATARDWGRVLDNLDTGAIPLMIDAGAAAVPGAALLAAAMAGKAGATADLTGSLGLDPLGILAKEGSLPFTLEAGYDEMACLTHWGLDQAPGLKTIRVDAAPYAEAGASAVQEIAFAAATGTAYIGEMLDRGLDIGQICPKIQFCFAVGPDFFMEIAKFRAARMVWSQISQAFGADPKNRKMVIHGRTQQYNKTRIDPWVNMLRVATETFSAIAGGCDSIHTSPFDEVARLPDEFSRRIARNVQTLFKEESHFDKVADPAGGSWYVEQITLALAQKAWHLFQEVEGMGGMAAALDRKFAQDQAEKIAGLRARNTATRKDRIVGVNMYPNLLESPLAPRQRDWETFYATRRDQVKKDMAGRDENALAAALEQLAGTGGRSGPDRMAAAVRAARAGASLGELSAALGRKEGTLAVSPLHCRRRSEPFEDLRRSVEAFKAKTGAAPQIFMATLGPLARHKPRLDFSTAFFNVAAFDTLSTPGFDSPDTAAQAALASKARAVAICGTDDDYMEAVPPLVKTIKAENPDMMVIVAGYASAYVENFRAAGVDEFIHLKADALAILKRLEAHLIPREENAS